MRLIFMGNPDFAVPSLQALVKSGHIISAVVTGRDKPCGRGRRVAVSPVKKTALDLGLRIIQPVCLDSPDLSKELGALQADLAVIAAFSILPESLIHIPRLGSVNLHASLLPKYRGAAPINWAIINGEQETGVTVFFIEKSVDTGKIIRQKNTAISPEDDFGCLYARLSKLGAEALLESVNSLEKGSTAGWSQDSTQATRAPKLKKHDGLIDWSLSCSRIHNKIRGLYPKPGSFCYYQGKRLEICKTGILDPDKAGMEPGCWTEKPQNSIFVNTGKGILEILKVKPENRKEMSCDEFIRGYVKSPPYKFGDENE
ncbi:MAG: methionyl-tRNA formyltransferase [bacterium]